MESDMNFLFSSKPLTKSNKKTEREREKYN